MLRSRIRSIKCCRTSGGNLLQVSIFGMAAKNHTPQLVTEAFHFLRIRSRSESLGQVEKLLPFPRLGCDSLFDEFDQHSIGAQAAAFRHAPNLSCDIRRKADALPDDFLSCTHNTSMHQNAVERQRRRCGGLAGPPANHLLLGAAVVENYY